LSDIWLPFRAPIVCNSTDRAAAGNTGVFIMGFE
jgi:hypothetical protein